MSFYQRYDLERLIADGEAKTFRAKENSTGRVVFLHLFNPEGQPLLAALQARFGQDPQNPVPPLLELGEFSGSPYAVTEPIAGFRTLREWLGRGANGEPLPPPPPRAPALPRSTGKTAEFERLFDHVGPPPASPQGPPQNDEPAGFVGSYPPPAPAKPQPRPQPPGGEFTQAFGSLTPKNPLPKPAPPPEAGDFTRVFGGNKTPAPAAPEAGDFTQVFGGAKKPAPPAPAAESGDFTRVFGGSKSPPAPAVPPRPSAPQAPPLETGQFTRFFGSGPSGEEINIEQEQARAAKDAPPESRPFQAPSEFTRVFGPEEGSPPRATPPQRHSGVSGASGIFANPKMTPPPRPLEPTKTSQAGRETGPGEYTRMIAKPKELDAIGAGPSPLAPVAAPKRGLMMIGLAVGTAVLLVIILIVVMMAIQKR